MGGAVWVAAGGAKAAEKADAAGNHELAEQIRAMWLKDMRKMAADLAEEEEAASKLLQHGNVRTTCTSKPLI